MAAPLFYPSREAILKAVRMGDVCSDSTAQPVVDQAMVQVRVEIYNRLGATLVTTLAALSYTETPTTTDELRRASAQSLEAMMLHKELLHKLPVGNIAAIGSGAGSFELEALTREAHISKKYTIKVLCQHIDDLFEQLGVEPSGRDAAKCASFGGTDVPAVGWSVAPGASRLGRGAYPPTT